LTELWPFVGRFHPLLVHFPIGILVLAGVLQLAAWWRRDREEGAALSRAISVILALGAATAVVSAATGYLLGTSGGYSGETYTRHRWLGIGVAVSACCAAIAVRLGDRPSGPVWRRAYIASLTIMLAALVGAAHLGATLTHGEGYLTEYAPAPLRGILARLGAGDEQTAVPSPDQALVYATLVQPVLQARCAACHGASKAEGALRLDSPDGLRKGGNGGPVFVAGRAAASEIVRRVWLPATHEDAMPPKGQPPLRPAEASLLRWWIDQGATFDQKLVDAEISADVLPAIEAVLGPLDLGGPTLPRVTVPAADAGAVAKLQQLGVSVVPVAAGTPFLHLHCTNVRATFGDAQLAALEPLARQLLWLDLSDTQITDSGLAVVAKFPNLTRLHLSRTPISDAGLVHLERLERLEYLNLYGTRITDQGVARLGALEHLRTLYVWQTAVTRQGVDRLRSTRPRLLVESGLAPDATRVDALPGTEPQVSTNPK
jgi:uncharacterized membrane protein